MPLRESRLLELFATTRTLVRGRIASPHGGAARPDAAAPESRADRLLALDELRRLGRIDAEEYAAELEALGESGRADEMA
jgi:hypothetical protein